MMYIRMTRMYWALFIGLLFIGVSQPARAQLISDWEASSGLFPEQISSPYEFYNDGPSTRTLNSGILTLTTTIDSVNAFYRQTNPLIDTSHSFYIQAGVRFVSGSSSRNDREGADIAFTTAPGVGDVLWIGDGVVFFQNPAFVRGPTAFVPTSDAIHNYQLNVAASGAVALFYDGTQILTDHTFSSFGFNGSQQRIIWGDGTLFAHATSEWTYFRHNALAVPEPSALALLLAGGMAGTAWFLRRRRTNQAV